MGGAADASYEGWTGLERKKQPGRRRTIQVELIIGRKKAPKTMSGRFRRRGGWIRKGAPVQGFRIPPLKGVVAAPTQNIVLDRTEHLRGERNK